jgi:hypothetical protein
VWALLNESGSCQGYNVNGMKIKGITVSTRKSTCPNAALSAIDSTWTGLGWNTGFVVRSQQATNGLRVNADENVCLYSRLVTRMHGRIVRH